VGYWVRSVSCLSFETVGNNVNHELTIRYNNDIVRRVARQFLYRWFGASGFFALALSWLMATGLIATGNRQWYVIALMTFVAVSSISLVAIFVIYGRRAVIGLRRFDPPDVRFAFTDDGLTCQSSLGESSLRWSAVQKVWRLKEAILVFVGPHQYITIPINQVPEGVLTEVLDRIRENGAPIG